MSGNPFSLLILAGGLSSRFGSDKSIAAIGPNGEYLLEYNLYDAIEAGCTKAVIVLKNSVPEELKNRLRWCDKYMKIEYVFQDDLPPHLNGTRTKPWGTGHALLTGEGHVTEQFLVINADDLYGASMFKQAATIVNQGKVTDSTMHLLAYPIQNTLSPNGKVNRGICNIGEHQRLLNIEEAVGLHLLNGQIMHHNGTVGSDTLVSMNAWLLHSQIFHYARKELELFINEFIDDQNKEFFLPDVMQSAIESGVEVAVHGIDAQWLGLTFYDDLEAVRKQILENIEMGFYPEELK